MTEAGWTLTSGEAAVEKPGIQDFFNLSHTCPGTPGDGNGRPTPSPAPTPSTPGEDGSGGEGGDDGDDEQPGLPVTGAQVGGLVVLGAGFLAAGIAMLAVRRHRRLPDLTGR